MPHSTLRWTTVTCLSIVLAGGVALADNQAGDSGQQTDEAEETPQLSPFVLATGGKPGSSTKVYGNAELQEMFGPAPDTIILPVTTESDDREPGSSPEVPGKGTIATEPDALETLLAAEAQKKEQAQLVGQGEQQVAAARQRLTELEKRMLAVRNPYLARPKVPEEGAEQWDAGDSKERVKQTEQQLAEARAAVTEAEQALAKLRSSAP